MSAARLSVTHSIIPSNTHSLGCLEHAMQTIHSGDGGVGLSVSYVDETRMTSYAEAPIGRLSGGIRANSLIGKAQTLYRQRGCLSRFRWNNKRD